MGQAEKVANLRILWWTEADGISLGFRLTPFAQTYL
jgi:hypothetical protein